MAVCLKTQTHAANAEVPRAPRPRLLARRGSCRERGPGPGRSDLRPDRDPRPELFLDLPGLLAVRRLFVVLPGAGPGLRERRHGLVAFRRELGGLGQRALAGER